MKRRDFFCTAALGAVAAGVMTGCEHGMDGMSKASIKGTPSALKFKNEQFYTDGKFDVEAAKDAIIAMCKYYGYPIFPDFRKKLWVSDYDTGRYTDLGLAAYMFVNNPDGPYMQMDLFMIPGQMLPEHWHEKGTKGITKNEGWLVRWGKSYIVGIGKNNRKKFPQIVVPKCHCNGTVTVNHIVPTMPGTFTPLAKTTTRHWQMAGPGGVIMTESANCHTDKVTFHSDKKINKYFLG